MMYKRKERKKLCVYAYISTDQTRAFFLFLMYIFFRVKKGVGLQLLLATKIPK